MEDKTFFWFQVTTQFEITDDNGKTKTTKEIYIVKAVSVTDAETQVVKDFEGSNIQFAVIDAKRSKVIKVMVPEGVDIDS